MSHTRKLMNVAMFIAFGIMLPIGFHFFGVVGSVFLPMHIPVLLAGLVLGVKGGLAVGVLTPIISSFTTGMPPLMPMLPVMVSELGVYGVASGYLYQKNKLPLVWALIGAMLAGRLASALVVAGMVALLAVEIKPLTFIVGAIFTGLPGILIQLLFVPLVVRYAG
ncbi:MAG: hypothetical protein H6Q72_3932 [Firmicutes bacterium]|nr:hypothetical protein [Bacillota bacterium]